MARITASDAKNLIDAYAAVYAPQELTEEQVWEEVENWVNSLLEEGYDLSEYTWEEMYESYLSEAPNLGTGGTAQDMINRRQAAASRPAPTFQNTSGYGRYPTAPQSTFQNTAGYGRYQTQVTPSTPTAPVRSNTSTAPVRSNTSTAPVRSNAPTTQVRPVPTAAPKLALGPTGKPMVGGIERRIPTSAELKTAQAARQAPAAAPAPLGSAPIQNRTATAFSPTAGNLAAPRPAAAPAAAKPNLQQSIRNRRLNMEMEYDTFDTVLEYLVSEGYADTNEAALVIMANMSEEWKQSIVEEYDKKEEDCVDKKDKNKHNCAKKVCHEEFGEGTCIYGHHSEPDDQGFVSHYDVLFEHGVEKAVPTSEMEVLVSESHGNHMKK